MLTSSLLTVFSFPMFHYFKYKTSCHTVNLGGTRPPIPSYGRCRVKEEILTKSYRRLLLGYNTHRYKVNSMLFSGGKGEKSLSKTTVGAWNGLCSHLSHTWENCDSNKKKKKKNQDYYSEWYVPDMWLPQHLDLRKFCPNTLCKSTYLSLLATCMKQWVIGLTPYKK